MFVFYLVLKYECYQILYEIWIFFLIENISKCIEPNCYENSGDFFAQEDFSHIQLDSFPMLVNATRSFFNMSDS